MFKSFCYLVFFFKLTISYTFKDITSLQQTKYDSLKLAFSFVIHQQVGLFELLLLTIFRPQHAYCVYVGSNTNIEIKESIEKLIRCYKEIHPETEIFLIKKSESVQWGDYSLLNADLRCFEELLKLEQ